MTAPRWLNPSEERAWRAYMRMRSLLDLQLGRDLARDSGLSMADYTVLVALSETPGQQLRLIELAGQVRWTTSRLSHQLERMRQRGLVCRREHPTNSRAAVIALTPDGMRTIQAAAPDHVESVRRHFFDLLTDEQIIALGDAGETVIQHLSGLAEHHAEHVDRTAQPGER